HPPFLLVLVIAAPLLLQLFNPPRIVDRPLSFQFPFLHSLDNNKQFPPFGVPCDSPPSPPPSPSPSPSLDRKTPYFSRSASTSLRGYTPCLSACLLLNDTPADDSWKSTLPALTDRSALLLLMPSSRLNTMPYNTRRKSLSLPSLGIHVPMTHAARAAAAAASRSASRPTSSSSSNAASPALSPPTSGSEAPEAHPNKRQKRSHGEDLAIEQTPPPSPTPDSRQGRDTNQSKINFEAVNDDIVEAVIVQLQSTGNRPHLVKDLATVLAQRLTSVQHSANPCAIISSRLASYLKRTCWSAQKPCPLAKELESVHPRRTYFFLTTCPRQPLPEPSTVMSSRRALETPSVSLTDDSGSDDAESRRRELSPSPEVDLSPHNFEDCDDDFAMPATPIGSLPSYHHYVPSRRNSRHNSPPLEKDEREFTQTADFLQKRKFTEEAPTPETTDRNHTSEYGYRDDLWFGDHRMINSTVLLTSPTMKPSSVPNITLSARKDDEAETWLKLNKLMEWDRGAESIEIDELDCLLDAC
ncbi:hypothetical protein FALBO_15164, partial [Fusarium albosuccineum]